MSLRTWFNKKSDEWNLGTSKELATALAAKGWTLKTVFVNCVGFCGACSVPTLIGTSYTNVVASDGATLDVNSPRWSDYNADRKAAIKEIYAPKA